jgi:thiamine-monophosphate kinase
VKRLETIGEIGEQELLQRLQRYCPADIVGDDAAIVPIEAGSSLVVTTDMLVDGVHFSDRTTSPFDVGWRSAAANLSDLAAMGASPIGITVALGLKRELSIEWVESLYQGLSDCLKPFQTPILGGDLCRSSVVTVSITAFGRVLPQQTIRRKAARPGDVIVVTGVHGASRGGLELLLHPEKGDRLDTTAKQALIAAHQRPRPRLDVLAPLWEIVGDRTIAGMDSSDGLANAIVQICRCSDVGAQIERQAIPISPFLQSLVEPETALEYALYGGEDFELVLCLPPRLAQTSIEKIGQGAAIIGEIVSDRRIEIIDKNCINSAQTLFLSSGFQHF